jgi:hypothetical protein
MQLTAFAPQLIQRYVTVKRYAALSIHPDPPDSSADGDQSGVLAQRRRQWNGEPAARFGGWQEGSSWIAAG